MKINVTYSEKEIKSLILEDFKKKSNLIMKFDTIHLDIDHTNEGELLIVKADIVHQPKEEAQFQTDIALYNKTEIRGRR